MQNRPDTTRGTSSKARQNPLESDSTGSIAEGRSAIAGTGASASSFGAGGSTADTMDQAKEKLADAASRAGDKVASRLDVQKDRAAQGLGSVAQALRQASDQIRNEQEGAAVHEYVVSAANQVERLSRYLRSTETREMVSGLERFARQQPALFVGGAFMLGLLGARFLKSSSQSNPYRSGAGQRSESFVPDGRFETGRGYSERGYSGATRSVEIGDPSRQSTSMSNRGGEDI